MFPEERMRRLRIHPVLRTMLRSVHLRSEDLVYPIFVRNGKNIRNPIASMPGQYQFSPDTAVKELEKFGRLGLKACILFGVLDKKDKDEEGSAALDEKKNPVLQSIRALKVKMPDLLVIADLCFCEYTSHGHCGVLAEHHHETVANDATLDILAAQSLALAKAGVDMLAPSGMMDGGVWAIRQALDENGYHQLPILAYSVKYASNFYGPFRDAAESPPSFGDRGGYQMDYARHSDEALREARLDLEEGADIIMVKPGLAYLDILGKLRDHVQAPLAVYHVSGEYAMLKAAGEKGWINEKAVLMETLIAFKRAGASMIISYSTPDALMLLNASKPGKER